MENFKHKKSLGQNFLKSEGALSKIAEAGEIKQDEWVLEIGPGQGVLTKKLLEKGAKVLAVEKDRLLIVELKKRFKDEIENNNLTLLENDILNFDIEKTPIKNNPYKIIANIPYYITGEILRMALSKWRQPNLMVLMVQKEVAKRICAKDNKESLLSISVKIYGKPEIIGIVKAGSFVPAPKVDSAIIKISNISKDALKELDEETFFEIVKTGFAHKRKMVVNNIKSVLGERTETIFKTLLLDTKKRPEDLNLENWIQITKIYSKN